MKSLLFILELSLIICSVDVEKHQRIVQFVNKLRTTWKAQVYDRDYSQLIGVGALKETKKNYPKKKQFSKLQMMIFQIIMT